MAIEHVYRENEALRQENSRLREELSMVSELLKELERTSVEQATELERAVVSLERQKGVLSAMLNAISDGLIATDTQGNMTHFNPAAAQITGMGKADSRPDGWPATYGIFLPDGVTPYPGNDLPLSRALRGEVVKNEEFFLRNPQRPDGVWLSSTTCPIRDEAGVQFGAIAVFRDVSERKRWEREMEEKLIQERERNDALERMRAVVAELSTPILEVWDDVLVLPVIGVVDESRSTDIMAKVLEEVQQRGCKFVLIDITGMDVIDTGIADRFLKIAAAVGMLGARCFLTGVRPTVAQTLVSLGVDLSAVATRRNLKHGLRECIRLMRNSSAQ